MDGSDSPRSPKDGRAPQSDLELVRRARRGEAAAFHGLVDRYASYLYGVAVSLLGNAADAEDAVQETLIGAFRGLRAFREQASVKTWLTGILVRQAAQHFRRGGAAGGKGAVAFQSAPEPADASVTDRADVRMDVREAVLALSPDHRDVIVLREMQGLSYQEIAQVLEIPQGTVESRLFRARRELQDLLKAYLT